MNPSEAKREQDNAADRPNPAEDCSDPNKECVKPLEHGPTAQNLEPHQASQTPEDLLEEEQMESFPASDPPSHTKAHS